MINNSIANYFVWSRLRYPGVSFHKLIIPNSGFSLKVPCHNSAENCRVNDQNKILFVIKTTTSSRFLIQWKFKGCTWIRHITRCFLFFFFKNTRLVAHFKFLSFVMIDENLIIYSRLRNHFKLNSRENLNFNENSLWSWLP